MKKNGFTLVELLATIALLGMLATIVITYSVKNTNRVKENSKESMVTSIELAAKNYALNNEDLIENFKINDCAYITLSTLINAELFTASLIDQTKELSLPLTDTVYITKTSNGIINATYDINQNNKPRLVLNGAYNVYVKKGSTYNELGATATSVSGTDISNTISITNTVENNVVGKYVVTYSVGESSISRNVIVF